MRISSPGVELEEADAGIESGDFFSKNPKRVLELLGALMNSRAWLGN